MRENKTYEMSESFQLCSILAVVGGYLDVYTYLTRGRVFATAQTGNIVLLGINLAEGNLFAAIRYILPVASFALGVVITEWVKNNRTFNEKLHWRQYIVLSEAVMLGMIAFVPSGNYNILINTLVSFVCALQVESFRKIHGISVATTMCTGNLRTATEYFFRYKQNGEREDKLTCLKFCGVIMFFILGAAVCTLLTGIWHELSVLVPCGLLIVVFFMMKIDAKLNE